MKRLLRGLATCLALLHADAGWGQSPQQGGPDHHSAQNRKSGSGLDVPDAFASAFADYRRFEPAVQPVDWRAANEEVRNAGGHVGLTRIPGAKSAPPRTDQKAAPPPAKRHH